MSLYASRGGGLFDFVGGLFRGAVDVVSSFVPGGDIAKRGFQIGLGYIGGKLFGGSGVPGYAGGAPPEPEPAPEPVPGVKMYLPARLQSAPPPAPQRATRVPQDEVQDYLGQGYTLAAAITAPLAAGGSETPQRAGLFGLGVLPIVVIIVVVLLLTGALKTKK